MRSPDLCWSRFSLAFMCHGRLVPGIHVLYTARIKTWMAGTRPAMTMQMASFMDMALGRGPRRRRARRGAGRLRDRARRRGHRARRQSHARRSRSDRACRNARHPCRPRPRSAPSGSTIAISMSRSSLARCAPARCRFRPHPPALLRRRRSQGRRGRQRREVFRLADLPSPAGSLRRHWRRRRRRRLLKEFFARSADERSAAEQRAELSFISAFTASAARMMALA